MNKEISLNIIKDCNLSCVYCTNRRFGDDIEQQDRKMPNLQSIITSCENAVENGVRRFCLSGGEPLLHEELEWFIKQIRLLDDNIVIALYTNGTLLADRLEHLIIAGLNEIHIQLDADNSYTYRRITGHEYMNEVLRGIWKAASKVISTTIHCTLMEQTKQSIPVLAGLAKTLDINVCFQTLASYPPGIEQLQQSEAIERLKKIYPDLHLVNSMNDDGLEIYYSDILRGRICFIRKRIDMHCCRAFGIFKSKTKCKNSSA